MFKQNGSTGTLVILIIVLVVVLGGGIYFLTQNNNTNTQLVAVVNPIVIPTSVILSPTAQATSATSTTEKTYKDSTYNYSLEYPSSWTLTSTKYEVYLKRNNATKAVFSTTRSLPEIYISIDDPYSTSGAVCADQSCIKQSSLTFKINGKTLNGDVVKGEVDGQFDFYAFSADLGYKSLSIYSSYTTSEEAQEVSQILSSIKY